MKPVRLMFTGTQRGTTRLQGAAIMQWLGKRRELVLEAHHGDCVGADEQFDALLEFDRIATVIHPPIDDSKRAWCFKRWSLGYRGRPPWPGFVGRATVVELPELDYLERNHAGVDATDALLAAPLELEEQLRSGTWATVRYARKLQRPIRFFWPDGSSTVERSLV